MPVRLVDAWRLISFNTAANIFYLEFDEKTFFGIPDDKWQYNMMKFDVILTGYRYDFGDFISAPSSTINVITLS